MNSTKLAYDQIASDYQAMAVRDHTAEIDHFLKMLPESPSILDLGCGEGTDAGVFVERGCSVVGIDFSKEMLKLATVNAPQAAFWQREIETCDLPEAAFDGVYASASLLHISKKNMPSVLETIHRTLKKVGGFYLSLKEGEGEGFEKDTRYDGQEKFWAYYREREITSLLEKVGFNVLEVWIKEINSSYQTHPFLKIFCRKI